MRVWFFIFIGFSFSLIFLLFSFFLHSISYHSLSFHFPYHFSTLHPIYITFHRFSLQLTTFIYIHICLFPFQFIFTRPHSIPLHSITIHFYSLIVTYTTTHSTTLHPTLTPSHNHFRSFPFHPFLT